MVMCVDLEHLNLTRLDMAPKEVPFDVKILSAGSEALVGRKKEGSVVVFQNSSVKASREGPRNVENGD